MSGSHVPEATMLRLSRYHCWVGERRHSAAGSGRLRSREMAEALGLSQETVRRDLSFIRVEGRPGAGYDPEELYEALCGFLDLTESHPFIAIGNVDVLRGLAVTFPSKDFGLRPAAYFSERSEDAGADVGGIEMRPLGELEAAAPGLGATIALVACEPGAVPDVLDALHEAGIRGVLMLTPVLEPRHPEGMNVTFFRMPCALKSLVSSGPPSRSSCCGSED